MESKRVLIVCGLMVALTVGGAAQDIRTSPGPVEKAAKPITPENPIPRRIFSVPPTYPPEARAVDASALVTMRVTLDASGRIAEIRPTSNPLVMVPPGTPSTPAMLQSVGEAMMRSAAAALSQWQYGAPADGPISFNVAFNFRPGAETTSTQDSRPSPGSGGANVLPPLGARAGVAACSALAGGRWVRYAWVATSDAPSQIRRVNRSTRRKHRPRASRAW